MPNPLKVRIHHVRPGSPHQLAYDLAFDVSAVVLLLIGWVIYRSAKRLNPS
ncbi:DUF2243 domain-containing protein [Alicyclobacillus tolerans]|uniref:DUF2243 domain-containing protein n=1 Tax=Alicyclobacillus tolerans TaxID=90970 RepID=UPI003557FCBE|nr:DUF2243 domain-containing protein [Alicyclobacillus tolerans]